MPTSRHHSRLGDASIAIAIATTCVLLALTALGASPAIARGKPGFTAKDPTRLATQTSWDMSYAGSGSWAVTEQGSSGGETWSDNESSDYGWHYSGGTGDGAAAGFGFIYPTPCHVTRVALCPPPEQESPGRGHATVNFKINDSDSLSGHTGTLACSGAGDVNAAPPMVLTATYIRGSDSYKITPGGGPLPSDAWPSDSRCPGAGAPGVTPLDSWLPGQLPIGHRSSTPFFAANAESVTIPARTFARDGVIQIPLSLLSRNAPPGDCALTPVSGESVTCDAKGSWQGIVTLTRVRTN